MKDVVLSFCEYCPVLEVTTERSFLQYYRSLLQGPQYSF